MEIVLIFIHIFFKKMVTGIFVSGQWSSSGYHYIYVKEIFVVDVNPFLGASGV